MKKRIFLSIISALLLAFAFPRFAFGFLAWVAFVPLFFVVKDLSRPKAFLLAYLTGVIFWFGNVYWLAHVTLIGLIVLVLYLAMYFGIFGLIFSTYSLQLTAYSLFLIPSIWVILEYIRSYLFSGFPWSLLGYTQYRYLPLIQISDITGVWGVSFLVMMGNVLVYSALSYKLSAVGEKKKLIFSLLIFSFVIGYGYFKLYRLQLKAYSLPLKISVVQGNIPQELKWASGPEEKILERYLSLSQKAALARPDLLIWPEAALPVVLESEPSFIQRVENFTQETKIPLLLGAVTLRDGLYYNSAVLVSTAGSIVNRYDKLHLVPFGEYIPLKQVFGFLQTVVPIGEIERGKEYTIFEIPNYKSQITNKLQIPISKQIQNRKDKFAVLICFEDLFPELSREFVKRGADFLVNITNDAWYKQTSAAYQHFQASVLRAVENRVYLVRCANTGISGFIAPSGKIISLVKDAQGKNIFVPGFDTQNIFPSSAKITFYSRYGDLFILLSLILCLISFF